MEPVAVSRRIAAPPSVIFDVLTNPARHVDMDGSGMVRGAVTTDRVTGVGDVFVIAMFFERLGEYEMNNHVVEYERDRRIAWEPESGRGHPEAGATDARWGQRWTYSLQPDGDAATIVTESYDCSAVPETAREGMRNGAIWIEAMTDTLRRLDELCTAPPSATEG